MTALGALQNCLVVEHQALYAYGVLGATLPVGSQSADKSYALASYAVHRARRDRLIALISREGATPRPAEPVYTLPFPVTHADQCRALARLIERRTAAAYCFAVEQCRGPVRRMAAAAVSDAAVRDLHWGDDLIAFPGAPDL